MTKENVLLANLFLNLKGNKKKRDDWITIAEKCKNIVDNNKNRKEAAKKLGVSPELIRSIISMLELPKDVKKLIREGKILFDAAQRLNTIKFVDKDKEKAKRIEVANEIAGLKSHEQREIIRYAKKFPNSGLKNYKKRVTATREIKRVHVLVIPLDEPMFKNLKKISKKRDLSLEKTVLELISEKIMGGNVK